MNSFFVRFALLFVAVFAVLFVVALIGALSILVRRYGFGMANQPIRKGLDRRLSLVEILPIDTKRRAVLIRRDTVEHLIILGPDSETAVESGIAAPTADDDDDFSQVLESQVHENTSTKGQP